MSMSRYAQQRITDLENGLAAALGMLKAIEQGTTFPAGEFYDRAVKLEQVRRPILFADNAAAYRAFADRTPAVPGEAF